MSDASWDNQGLPPEKKGWPTWLKVALGCGCGCVGLVAVVTVSCVGMGSWISRHPERFERFVKDKVQDWARDDWNLLRRTVDQLRTPEGTRVLFEAHPRLAEEYGDLASFEKAAGGWRPLLQPVPEAIPDLDSKVFDYNRNPGRTRIGFRQADGTRVRIDIADGSLVRIQVTPKPAGGGQPESKPESEH